MQTDTDRPQSVFAVDLDGDGDQDILSASKSDNKIAWYENTDGNATFGKQKIITESAQWARDVFATDIDGDGDQDVLSASEGDNKIAWYENIDGNGNFGSQNIITDSAEEARSVFACDLDGDGDQDVLSASYSDGIIAWYNNIDGNGNFGPREIITVSSKAIAVYAADLDGDGDQDILAALYNPVWIENLDGNGTFGPPIVLSTYTYPFDIHAEDLDGDGDLDILTTTLAYGDNRVIWYENTNGSGNFGPKQTVTTIPDGPMSVFATDLDGDGDHDVLCASYGDDWISWYENIDGNGSFSTPNTISLDADKAMSVYACDLDGDSDQDVLSASLGDDKLAWYDNTDGNASFESHVITNTSSGAMSVCSSDIDGDGDMDALSASNFDNKIAWYENIDGYGTYGEQQIITNSAYGAFAVRTADIDGDGDQDVVSASHYDSKIAWYQNTDGNGLFGDQLIISDNAILATDVRVVDIDGDGDLDVVSSDSGPWMSYEGKIAWYENLDGLGTYGEPQNIQSGGSIGGIYVSDLDGDGDMDVLGYTNSDNYGSSFFWYRNTDGNGTFAWAGEIRDSEYFASCILSTDIDGDGDQDVIVSDILTYWFENIDGNGLFGIPQEIPESSDVEDIYSVDIDGDGDEDILAAISNTSYTDKMVWYENTDGSGSYGNEQMITSLVNRPRTVFAADIDGDGDQDALSASYGDNKIAWYRNATIVSVELISDIAQTVYPNPTNGLIYVDNPDHEIKEIRVSSMSGKVLIIKSNIQQNDILDLSSYRSGMYIISLQTKTTAFSTKIVKK